MPLNIGDRLAHYDVIALIGEGGMGQVYRATDTKLNRDVALKILPDAFAADPDRLARFQREAQVLASLNHPGIAQIYGTEEDKADGTRALVLELVEGPTLADRIAHGAMPIEEALPIARQIAEALEAAHEAGVIHRDLKPANIKVREDGTVKVLDFGLAKALDTAPESDPSQSPTLTAAATQMGVIMGTAAYMSPEQARGKPTDRRADIWAFGAVLYEILTGARAFQGEDVSMTLSSVLQREPDWSVMPLSVPAGLRTYLRRCLEKDLRERVQAIGDVRLAMEGAFETDGVSTGDVPVGPVVVRSLWWRALPFGATAVIASLIGSLAAGLLTPSDPRSVVVRLAHDLPDLRNLTLGGRSNVAISPDDAHFVYSATGGLHLQAMDSFADHLIPGTGGLSLGPVFSPDGQSVAYVDAVDAQLKRIAVTGGVPVALTDAPPPPLYGVSWGTDGTILYAQADGI